MFGVVRYPYMPTDVDRAIQAVANDIGRGETHNKAPLAVYFGTPGVDADDQYFGGVGPRRTGCISCGNCNNGCGRNAKNKLTTNYLFLAEKLGAQVHDMHEVFDLVPLEGGGFEVHARHPGWAQRAGHLHHSTYTAEQVIVAAHAYGSAKLLHHMQHKGRLTGLSSELGKRARTNSEQLLYITRTHEEWERDPGRIHSKPSGTPPSVHVAAIEDFVDRVATQLGAHEAALATEMINRNASAHFVGGIPIGESSETGAVDPYLRMFGQPGLHVMDGSVMPANPGVNPSLSITALVERAISLWPNKGDEDTRPPLGSGYERVEPVMPHRPVVPAGAPGELATRREEVRRHSRIPLLNRRNHRRRR